MRSLRGLLFLIITFSCVLGAYFRLTVNQLAPDNLSEISFSDKVLLQYLEKGEVSINEFKIVKLEDKGQAVFRLSSDHCQNDIYFYADTYNIQIPNAILDKFFPPEKWKYFNIYKGNILSGLTFFKKLNLRIRAKAGRFLHIDQGPADFIIFTIVMPLDCNIEKNRLLAATETFTNSFNK